MLSGLIQVLCALYVNPDMAPKFQKCVSGVIEIAIMETDLKFSGMSLETGAEHVKQWAIPAKIKQFRIHTRQWPKGNFLGSFSGN